MSKIALMLSGGGARAAYQVGVLKAVSKISPQSEELPFDILCGTSSGAMNAAKLATEADQFQLAVQRLCDFWSCAGDYDVHSGGMFDVVKNTSQLMSRVFKKQDEILRKPFSLFQNQQVYTLLQNQIDFSRLDTLIEKGVLSALCINTLCYSSGYNIAFYQGLESYEDWQHGNRLGVRTELEHKHIMASSALPVIFPPVEINGEFYGDGALRQTAPMSSALRLGAQRMMVIGISGNDEKNKLRRSAHKGEPSVAQIVGHLLNSAFIDVMEDDIHMLERLNKIVDCVSPEDQQRLKIRPIEILEIKPQFNFDELAESYVKNLPRSTRVVLNALGATRRGNGSSFATYLLFDNGYCSELIDRGYQDAMLQAEKIYQFLHPDG